MSRAARARRAAAAALLGCVLAARGVGAQEPRVRATVRPSERLTDTTRIQLIIEAQGTGNLQFQPPRLSGLTNLRVLAGPSTNFSSVWSNGRFSATSQLIYTLVPDGPGVAEVPSIQLQIDGRTYHTQPLRLQIGRSQGGVPPPPAPPQQRGRPGAADANVFLRAELGATDVWVGQSVPLTVSLYAAERVLDFDWTGEPSLSSFWAEDLEVDPNAEAYGTAIEGRRYDVYPIKRKILVPQAAGEFEIEPWVAQIQVRARSLDPLDILSFGRGTTVARKSQPLSLRVRELPAEGRPAGFSGAVGTYSLTAEVDRGEAAVNEAVALRATVEGEGFLGAVEAPAFHANGDLKVFDPKISSSSRSARGRILSRKTWEWVLVPLEAGQIDLSELSFSYFDPVQGSYATATATLDPLVVRRGEVPGDIAEAPAEIRAQRRDLEFIKRPRGPLSTERSRAYQRPSFAALLLAPLLWVPLVILAGRRYAGRQRNRGLVRARNARGRALRRLKAARRLLSGGPESGFHEEIARALVDYVADRFDRAAAGLTYEMADELLAARGAEPELRRRFRSCLERCDFARFVPSSGQDAQRGEVLEEATALVDQLERAC